VFSPKFLLRHPLAISSMDDMKPGTMFMPVLDDASISNPKSVKTVCFTSGKVYYDLIKERSRLKKDGEFAFIRYYFLQIKPMLELKSLIPFHLLK
jgi:probable 2-oxoglutarate dehydrogenase E1 component DHKTD1